VIAGWLLHAKQAGHLSGAYANFIVSKRLDIPVGSGFRSSVSQGVRCKGKCSINPRLSRRTMLKASMYPVMLFQIFEDLCFK
jgi:hypothetical protein